MHVAAELLVRRQGKLGVFVASDKAARFHPAAQRPGRPSGQGRRFAADSRVVVRGQGTL
jgi:hypothetical protein